MEDYRNQTEEINLIDMFFYVLKKWRPILIWGIIGLVIGCGFSFFKMKQMDPQNLDGYFASLKEKGDEELNEDNITIYKDYKALYDGVLERGKKSIVLNMDPNETFSTSLTYFFSSDSNDTVEAFFNTFFDTEDYQTLINVSGLDCEIRDIREMVSLTYFKTTESNLIVDSAYLTEDQTGKLGVSVIAPSEEILSNLVEQIKMMIAQGIEELKLQCKGLSSKFLSEISDYGYNGDVANRQNSFIEERVSYLKNMNTYKDKLSDVEKLYIEYYYPNEETKLENSFSLIWPIAFFVVLAFMVVAVYAISFVANGNINCEREIDSLLPIYVISFVKGKEERGLDKVFEKWSKSNSPQNSSLEYVAAFIQRMGLGKVAICYNGSSATERFVAEKLSELCKERVELMTNFETDSNSLNTIALVDDVIVLINVEKTRKVDLVRLTNLCKHCGKVLEKAIVIR